MEEKNLSQNKIFLESHPSAKVFERKYAEDIMEGRFLQKGRGGDALARMLTSPINQSYDGMIKGGMPSTQQQYQQQQEKIGKRVYVAAADMPPEHTPVYRGKHGGRFFLENEKGSLRGSSTTGGSASLEQNSLAARVAKYLQKEYNNLGAKKLHEPAEASDLTKPNLPMNQGALLNMKKGKQEEKMKKWQNEMAQSFGYKDHQDARSHRDITTGRIPKNIVATPKLPDTSSIQKQDQSKFDSGITPATDPDRHFPSSTLSPENMTRSGSKKTTDLFNPSEKNYQSTTESLPDIKHMLKSVLAILQKQNLPSYNPTGNPMTGGGMRRQKANDIRSKLQSGSGSSFAAPKFSTSDPATSAPKQLASGGSKPQQLGAGFGSTSATMADRPSYAEPKIEAPAMRSRGPRNLPFAQFSLADRIAKYLQKQG